MHAALFYQTRPDHRVICTLCPHNCHIADGSRGACAVRYNHGGHLYTLVYDKVVARHADPVEKKPLFHFFPGSIAYSIATVGCSLRCSFCQNWLISEWPKEHLPKRLATVDAAAGGESICPQLVGLDQAVAGEPATPAQLVEAARQAGASSIAYTYTEPTIFYELAYDTAVLARAQGLRNILVTNGFISEAPLRQLAPVIDAANIDLKFFQEASYRHISRARLEPILAAIRRYRELGVWVEVTTLIIPGLNDSDGELRQIAEFIGSVGPEIPWHVTRYYPMYQMRDRPPTPVATLKRAAEIGQAAGLRYIYQGNSPAPSGERTYCYRCQTLLIDRQGFSVRSNRLRAGCCPCCGTPVDGFFK